MAIALESGQQYGEQCPQTLATHAIGSLPQHDQRPTNGFIIERCPLPALAPPLGCGSTVQNANRRFVVIAGCRDELFQDLALVPRRSRGIPRPYRISELRPRG